jgi:ACS family hexuronate transporter-like MFS transporter
VKPLPIKNRLRWVILALLFLATVLNYVDRQTLSILASHVQKDLKIDDVEYSQVVQAFLVAYTAAYLLAGWVTDRLGARVTLALFLGWWSLANMATGWVRGATELGFVRAMLGLGEPGVYTAGPKAIQEHFSPEKRGFAFGVFTSGAMVGATLAPPLIGGIALTWGWRSAFVLSGGLGFILLAAWLLLYPRSAPTEKPLAAVQPVKWGAILSDPSVWGLAASRMLSDPVWYFYLFWFPKYLTDERGMSLLAVARSAWVVYLAADIGSIGGGWISGRLIRRGISPAKGRLLTMTGAALLSPFGILIALHPSIDVTLALGALVAFAHLVLQINVSTLIIDTYPKPVVATVFGVIAAGSGVGGILSTGLVGHLVAGGSYDLVFLLMGILHPLSCGAAWAAIACRKGRDQDGSGTVVELA